MNASPAAVAANPDTATPRWRVIGAVSAAHFLNDMMQSLILALYPLLKGNYALSFAQIGLLTLVYQCTASLLQPMVGMFTDRRPQPYAMMLGMLSTLAGLLLLSQATQFDWLLVAAALVGTGSSIFHPESSRVVRLASAGHKGLAQSLFQVGGNGGTATGPLLAMLLLWQVGNWYRAQLAHTAQRRASMAANPLSPADTRKTLAVLMALVATKYTYMASLHSYFTFYLIERFALPTATAQLYLFAFLLAVAGGTLLGGPLGDRIGRRRVIWFSIFGSAPFALALPHVGLGATLALVVIIGLILSSAFSAILVYAQELLPQKVGTISGLFFGLAFGVAGLAAAALGQLADHAGIQAVYQWCAWLPLAGIIAALLPELRRR